VKIVEKTLEVCLKNAVS